MTGFIPRDCLSCVDALNETYRTLFRKSDGFSELEWSKAFADWQSQRSAGLKGEVADQMKQAVHDLQSQFFEGERTACYVSEDGLADIKPSVFGFENAAQIIASNGKIRPDMFGRSHTFFVRPRGYERSDHPVGSAQHEEVDSDKNSSGRPSTGRDAALVYWGMFPDGHESKQATWKAALRDVNRRLDQLGLKNVRMTAFKVHVNKLRPRE